MDDPQSEPGGSEQNENASGIVYRKLRSPSQHGQRLDFPPLTSVDTLWQENLKVQSANCNVQVGGIPLVEFQQTARAEVVKLATKYSRAYLDLSVDAPVENIVMAGHQPELFHPGVWFKNFVLSNLGQRFNCAAINLVVDNDICGNTSIRYPKIETDSKGRQTIGLGSIQIDASGPNDPFETREIQDWSSFEAFGVRAAKAISPQVPAPIVNRLWPNAIEAAQRIWGDHHRRIGHAIAAGRHRLEQEIGLRTLEVPISWVSTTRSFAVFTSTILNNASRFRDRYNQTLFDYRGVHRIRSTSHPVPELEKQGDWIEVPFWVWQKSNPVRRRLYARQVANRIELSDLAGWETKLSPGELADQLTSLNKQGIAIRPKALMTTMYSRLLLCDLFLHGIGGAKYDQLTDVIAQRFFSVELPQYLTLTATMKLPTGFDLTRYANVADIDQQIRELKFHPETLISTPSAEATELIKQKQNWTKGERRSERSREKHRAIEALNQHLAQFADVKESKLVARHANAQSKIRESQIIDSREYSFCLFPESLISELQQLAALPSSNV